MYTTVRETIKSTRQAQQMNTRDFANHLGVSQNMISLWERGAEPSRETLSRLLACGTPWVRDMALDIFAIQQRSLLSSSLPTSVGHGTDRVC
jgi:transcriptional regulator with XRE-family HTH domain